MLKLGMQARVAESVTGVHSTVGVDRCLATVTTRRLTVEADPALCMPFNEWRIYARLLSNANVGGLMEDQDTTQDKRDTHHAKAKQEH